MKSSKPTSQRLQWSICATVSFVLMSAANVCVSAATITPIEFGSYQQITPQRAVVRQNGNESLAPAVLYNGAGLNHKNPLLAAHSADPAAAWQFQLDGSDYPVSVEFDLGGEFLLNEMWLWQLPEELFPGQAVSEFDIVMRGGDGEELGVLDRGEGRLKSAGLLPVPRFNAFGECVFLPIPDCVRYVELRIYSNMGAVDTLGLEEVSFFGRAKIPTVPEPATVGMLMLGGLAVIAQVRKGHR